LKRWLKRRSAKRIASSKPSADASNKKKKPRTEIVTLVDPKNLAAMIDGDALARALALAIDASPLVKAAVTDGLRVLAKAAATAMSPDAVAAAASAIASRVEVLVVIATLVEVVATVTNLRDGSRAVVEKMVARIAGMASTRLRVGTNPAEAVVRVGRIHTHTTHDLITNSSIH
jgi:hypothetical protein